jgi:hypothetical protein
VQLKIKDISVNKNVLAVNTTVNKRMLGNFRFFHSLFFWDFIINIHLDLIYYVLNAFPV